MAVFKKIKPFLFCAVSAVFLILAFPHTSWRWLAWIGLVPFLTSLDSATYRGAFGRGYFFGFLYYLGTIWWIGHVTVLGMFLLVAYLAFYYAAFAVFYRFVSRSPFWLRLILVPAAYVALEFVRDHALTGFGWASLGHTQEAAFVAGIVAVTGVAGVSFLIVAANVFLKELFNVWRSRGALATVLRSTFGLGVVLVGFIMVVEWPPVIDLLPREVKIALVQPNITLGEMWTESGKPKAVRKLLDLSRTTLVQKPELIIWPETSFPHFIWEQTELFDEVKAFAREHRVSLLIGAVTRKNGNYYNSAILISPEGEVVQTYSKRHLVLFGEYIPFRKELPFLSSIVPIDDFTPGTEDAVFTLPNGVQFSVLICFEDALPALARRHCRKGADFLVNMTNDAWFRDSGQPEAHLDNASFRAAENRVPLVRATNTGVSCLISDFGEIGPCVQDAAGRRVLTEGAVVVSVRQVDRGSFYNKHGDVFTLACGLGILIFAVFRLFYSELRTGRRVE